MSNYRIYMKHEFGVVLLIASNTVHTWVVTVSGVVTSENMPVP
jgi:hypothetical protein